MANFKRAILPELVEKDKQEVADLATEMAQHMEKDYTILWRGGLPSKDVSINV